jgi:pyruvate dehydrogenase E2 component (dihydrolipoamide acetyltransferase)
MFGVSNFTAIINPPQSCILAVGGVSQRLSMINSEGDPVTLSSLAPLDSENVTIIPQSTLTLTLSCDHRVVDGAQGAQFLQKLKSYLENPLLLVAL